MDSWDAQRFLITSIAMPHLHAAFLARTTLVCPMSEPQEAKNSYDGYRSIAKHQLVVRRDAPPSDQGNRRNNPLSARLGRSRSSRNTAFVLLARQVRILD